MDRIYAKMATEKIIPKILSHLKIPSYRPPRPETISLRKESLSIQLLPSLGVSKKGSLFGSSRPFPRTLPEASPKVRILNSSSTSPPVGKFPLERENADSS
jgi:hypothetical protein